MIHNSLFFIQGLHRRIFFFLLLLLPTQLGLHFWPEWSYVVGRRIDYLSPTLYLTDVVIACMLLFNFGERALQKNEKKKPRIYFSLLSTVTYVLPVVVYITFNIVFSMSPWVACYKWLKVIEFVGVGWYIVANKPQYRDILFYLSVGVAFSSLLAIAQFFLQHSIGGFLWIFGERTFTPDTPGIARFYFHSLFLRPYATFSHPNVLGGFLATLLPLILYQYIKHKKLFYLGTSIIGIVALVFSFSRSAWMAGGLGLGVMVWSLQKKRIPSLFSLFRLLIPLLLFFGLIILFRPSLTDESVVYRIELNRAAIAMWKQAPLFGVGLGNYITELPRQTMIRQGNFLQPAHNIYLLALSELGLVGIGLIVICIVYLVKHELKIMKQEKSNRYSNNFVIIINSLFIILLIGFVDHYFLTLQQGQLLTAVLLGLVVSNGRRLFSPFHKS